MITLKVTVYVYVHIFIYLYMNNMCLKTYPENRLTSKLHKHEFPTSVASFVDLTDRTYALNSKLMAGIRWFEFRVCNNLYKTLKVQQGNSAYTSNQPHNKLFKLLEKVCNCFSQQLNI